MLEVPAVVRAKALAVGAQAWLDALPELVAELAGRWSLTLGRVYGDATEGLVIDAGAGVLKLHIPGRGGAVRDEIRALELAGGDGCVALLRSDAERGALLLERLGRSLHELKLPIERRHEILVATAMRVWRPATGLPTGAEKGRWLIGYITTTWEETGRPCSERAVEHALACAERRIAAHDDERAVLVHGDVHEWNALEAPGGGFKLVDPDGLLAEPEYDLGVMMREDPVELTDPDARARRLAELAGGLDPVAISEWGAVERVSTGLLAEKIGLQPVGRQMLAAAERITPLA